MVHALTLTAVKRKLHDFDHIPRFINCKEIFCALGMAYRQAGLNIPELPLGAKVMETLPQLAAAVQNSPAVETCIKDALNTYSKLGETIDEDAVETMKLGYQNPS